MRPHPYLLQQVTQNARPFLVKASHIPISPSSPIFIHHNKILSIKTTSLNKIQSQTQYQNILKSIVFGGFYSKYRKFESLIPFELFISGNNNNKLILDGTIDWAILPRKALTGYKGIALNVSQKKTPWKSGLATLIRSGYIHISGRGEAFINSSGDVHTIKLEAGEQIIVRRDGIVALSVNGKELGEATEPVKFGDNTYEEIELNQNESIKSENELKDIAIGTWNTLRKGGQWLWDQVTKDEFVRIKGPRNVILSSDVSTSFEFNKNSDDIGLTETLIQKAKNSTFEH
ncbi:hypothetical protein BN7_4920 [Wickerhamomyces ciferrii]|uniref:Altered inheritance of mitochondria protein 24, mitochondrial n=1 Tax=Wickerhamomyces ciferrii (strain ATCC 14091 / BCRC 22168 / CBS 111 / JCM 3599 / NBRC 0793 / NRRL Y-1031 F-60-10) TaxID=1206466 RepID=K0KW36_WICCF|nr:uncharacterized protein BN7_4920 [Wickerhamomyces ciferrii]CCH45338.1 hypothetical protein BN7_4920 [Wickerhamomyces ciferrii]